MWSCWQSTKSENLFFFTSKQLDKQSGVFTRSFLVQIGPDEVVMSWILLSVYCSSQSARHFFLVCPKLNSNGNQHWHFIMFYTLKSVCNEAIWMHYINKHNKIWLEFWFEKRWFDLTGEIAKLVQTYSHRYSHIFS